MSDRTTTDPSPTELAAIRLPPELTAVSFSRVARWIIAACFVLGGAAALRMVPSPDVSWLLVGTERLLLGARFGTEIIEVNPPLIVWLYTPAVLVARVSAVSAPTALALMTLVFIAFALGLVRRVLRESPHRTTVVTALAAALLLIPGLDFGQREHLAAVLCAPWIALAIARAEGREVPTLLLFVAAAVGAVGLLLKPFFGLAWLAIETVLVYQRGVRSLVRRENLVLAVLATAYVLAVVLLAPGFIDLTRLLGPAYGAYLTHGVREAFVVFAGAVLFALYRLGNEPHLPAATVLQAASVGFVLAAAVQLKWWPYHFVPGVAYAIPALALMRPRAKRGAWRLSRALSMSGHALALYLLAMGVAKAADITIRPEHRGNLAEPYFVELRELVRARAHLGPVMVFSTNIQSGFPVVPAAGAEWASRLPSLWPLMGIYSEQARGEGAIGFRRAAERTGLERWLNEVILEDLRRFRPATILVLAHDPVLGDSGEARRLDYMKYLSDDARIRHILEKYRPASDVGRYHVLIRSD